MLGDLLPLPTGASRAFQHPVRVAGMGESSATDQGGLPGDHVGPVVPAGDWMASALHVSNGDATDIRGTGLARRVLYWRDALHEGPVPALDPERLRRVRAAFLSEAGADDRHEGTEMFAERDRVLAANRDGEYVLWFEADLYDQLQIIQILSRLADLGVAPARISLICIGEHPDSARFGGLGELSAAQLRALSETNALVRLTSSALDLATRAWDAFRSPTPDGLAAVAATRSVELRFLGEAFDRLGREYPSTRDGLSLTERRVLAAVANGAKDAGTAFVDATARETRPYLGDDWCFAMIHRLASAAVPLLNADPTTPQVDHGTRLRLTTAGAGVLAGEADYATLNGIDRWIGGVHLQGRQPRWRWEDASEIIVSQAPPP